MEMERPAAGECNIYVTLCQIVFTLGFEAKAELKPAQTGSHSRFRSPVLCDTFGRLTASKLSTGGAEIGDAAEKEEGGRGRE
jgi:hypothetical protein